MSFDDWYQENVNMLMQMTTRKEVAFHVWTNKPKSKPGRPAGSKNKSAKTSAKILSGYSEEFEMFWNLYPKKTGKGLAFDVWKKLFGNNPPIEDITKSLSWQVDQQAWKNEDGKYVPMPSTYLNQRRWEDEQPRIVKPKHSEVYF